MAALINVALSAANFIGKFTLLAEQSIAVDKKTRLCFLLYSKPFHSGMSPLYRFTAGFMGFYCRARASVRVYRVIYVHDFHDVLSRRHFILAT